MNTAMDAHPVRLVVEDDLGRSRLTVFFRLLLAIPHYIWFSLWSIAVAVVVLVQWLVILVRARPAAGLHRFLERYVRYTVHLSAYLYLAASPFPPFDGDSPYPMTLEPIEPERQSRLGAFFRLVLAIPCVLLQVAFFGVLGGARGGPYGFYFSLVALVGLCSVLTWWHALVLGRAPRGLRDVTAYALGYQAQVGAYTLLVTGRYPSADPTAMLGGVARPPQHPVHLEGDAGDLRRSRLTVFFRLPLVVPHYVWLALWNYAAVVVGLINWFATLFMGRSPRWCHRFLSRYIRYQFHVLAFLSLAANPFPGFTGRSGSYPLDLALPAEPQRQNRWKTGFRLVLAIPAWIVCIGLYSALAIAAMCTWFASLATGRAPWGLRNLLAFVLRYVAQTNAYVFLLTDRYPHASPLEGEDEAPA